MEESNLINTPSFFSKALYFTLYSIAEAMRQANWSSLNKNDAVLLGTTTGMLKVWEDELVKVSNDEEYDHTLVKYQHLSALEEEIRYAFNFSGKIITFTSACSASTQAYINAYNLLKSKRVSRCIAGGVEELGDLTIKGFSSLKILSQENCKPFDLNRTGVNLSEGAAFNCLELKSDYKGIKLLAGSTVMDCYHVTSPHPEGLGYKKSINKTLKLNNLTQGDIDLVHAHGTGSHHNDTAESAAIYSIFKKNNVPVISTKGVHGHCLAASGALELNISIKMLIEALILPSSKLTIPDSSFNISLSNKSKNQKIKRILKSTLGFGGINTTVILEKNHD